MNNSELDGETCQQNLNDKFGLGAKSDKVINKPKHGYSYCQQQQVQKMASCGKKQKYAAGSQEDRHTSELGHYSAVPAVLAGNNNPASLRSNLHQQRGQNRGKDYGKKTRVNHAKVPSGGNESRHDITDFIQH